MTTATVTGAPSAPPYPKSVNEAEAPPPVVPFVDIDLNRFDHILGGLDSLLAMVDVSIDLVENDQPNGVRIMHGALRLFHILADEIAGLQLALMRAQRECR